MARPAPSTHTTTARTWTARLADGRTIQFSAPVEQLTDRLLAEARAERTQIVDVTTAFPPAGWATLHRQIADRLVAAKAMTLAPLLDGQTQAA